MTLFRIAGLLILIWAVGALMGKGGFIHILLISGLAILAVRIIAIRRASFCAGDE